MHQHGPDELIGPIRGSSAWWRGTAGEAPLEAPEEDEDDGPRFRKKRRYVNDPNVRHDLVERVRREIAAGTYDTPEKFQQALDRMADQFLGE